MTRVLLRLAVRNLLRHPWRTAATVVGVGVGIAAVLASLSVGANVRSNLQADFAATVGRADLLVTPGAGGRAVMPLDPVEDVVRALPEVAAVAPVLNARVEPVREVEGYVPPVVPGVDSGFQLSGRAMAAPDALPADLVAGRWPAPNEAALVMARPFAEARGFAVGDDVAFATRFGEATFGLVGLVDGATGYGSSNGGRVALAPLAAVQSAVRLDGRASLLEIEAAPGVDVATLRAALEATLDARYDVGAPAGRGELAGGIVETLQAGLLVLAATLLALGGFLAYNTFMASVVERTRTYALLRTVALRRRDVRRLAMFEAALVAAAGVVFGVAFGIALAWVLTWANAFGLGFEVRGLVVPWTAVATAAAGGVAVALVAGSWPARLASRAAPLAARRAAEAAQLPSAVRWGVAAILVGLAVTRVPWEGPTALAAAAVAMAAFSIGVSLTARALLGPAFRVARPALRGAFGVAGDLASAFAARSANRNGVAVGTVVVGTGLVIGVGAMVAGINAEISDWVDATITGDLFVTSPVAFPDDFEARLTALPAVDVASGVGIRAVRYRPPDAARGRTVALILVDPARFDPALDFGRFLYVGEQGDDAQGYATLRSNDGVLISATMQERYGLGVGDVADLRTRDGFAPFRVGGVVVDFTGGGETVIASIDALERFGGGTPDLYVLLLDPAADPSAVAADLRARFPELYLDATPNDAYKAEIVTLSQRTFRATNTLLGLAVAIAALGVANTLGMNLATRGRDLATLRVLGVSRDGVRRIVVAEGLVVVVLGSVLGVAFGLALADVVTAGAEALTGYELDPAVPWSLVGVALLASPLVGLLASWAPARRAARLAPIEALKGST
ncbi:MAG: FtsX-like permease family protein [Trueperaceae bacterium]|nr:FtsX-like permease family protein [Trueperaceae bacterium]